MKYTSKDSRTGYAEGSVVELSKEELDKTPFNVFLEAEKKVVSDAEFEKKSVEDAEKEEAKALEDDLLNKGLSAKRTKIVVEKYKSKEEMVKNVEKIGVDPLTDEFIRKNYAPLSEKNKKRVEDFAEDLADDGKRNYSNKKKKKKESD